MTTITDELKAGRDLDADVARVVFGHEVVGKTTCVFVEGEWSIHPDSEGPKGWSCYAENGPVYVERCSCDDGPSVWGEDVSSDFDDADKAAISRLNDRSATEFATDMAKFGHSRHCLEVVPNYSTDVREAWRVVEHMKERWHGEDLNRDVWTDWCQSMAEMQPQHLTSSEAAEFICRQALNAFIQPPTARGA